MNTNIELIVNQFGNTASRKAIQAFCFEKNISFPSEILEHPTGVRGVYNLSVWKNVITNAAEPTVEMKLERTQEEIAESVKQRFSALDDIAAGLIEGHFRAVIVSGNPGVGKTYNLEYQLNGAAEEGRINLKTKKGYMKATGIYKLLYEFREKGSVVMFDDADSVFQDDVGLNILKAALDTTKRRWISWGAETKMELADGEKLPTEFEYEGSVIFISNMDFDLEVSRSNKVAPHLKALISRSLYINLNLDDEELTERIASVIRETDMMYVQGVEETGQEIILDYFFDHCYRFREKSLRTIVKLANIYKASSTPASFYKMANATCIDPRTPIKK